jgi:dephospho-CoA kinase
MEKKIGITGGSGSGKGFVCKILSDMGYHCIDTDKVVHILYTENSECLEELKNEFGDGIFENGILVRRRLGDIVFSNSQKLARLNEIVHKYVILQCDAICRERFSMGETAVFIDAPQLFEAGMDKSVDAVVSVVADSDVRLARIIERDKIDRERALSRINNQHSDDFFVKNSDFVIHNTSETEQSLTEQVKKMIEALKI